MCSFKRVLYWLSIVRPITDILVGVCKGVVLAIQDIRADEYYKKQVSDFEASEAIPFENESEEKNG